MKEALLVMLDEAGSAENLCDHFERLCVEMDCDDCPFNSEEAYYELTKELKETEQ